MPVAQYARGYFYRSDAVTYTKGMLPDNVPSNQAAADQMLDFLFWRYCIFKKADVNVIAQIFKDYAESDELFPLREELSYGAHAMDNMLVGAGSNV